MEIKGLLNSQTIRNALASLVTYALTAWDAHSNEITVALAAALPAYLAPHAGAIVGIVGSVLAAFFTARTVRGRVKAGEQPSQIKGLFRKP